MNTRPITQDALNVVQRHLNMAALSLPELRTLIEKHRNNPAFGSRVIVSAARQILAKKHAMVEGDELGGILACPSCR